MQMGISLFLGELKWLPGWFGALMYRQNGDLTYLIKSARLSAGGGCVIATFGNAQIDIA